MKDQWEFSDLDMQFLQDVGKMEFSMVAHKWAKKKGWEIEKAENNARGWVHRIRVRVSRCQNYVNRIYALQKQSPRIRKFTTMGALQNQEEDDTDEET